MDLGVYKHLENVDPIKRAKEFSEFRNTTIRQVIFFSILAGVVFVTGYFSWWIGFVLYLLFALDLLVGIVFSGVILLLIGWITRLCFSAIKGKPIRAAKVNDIVDLFIGAGKSTAVLALVQTYYLLLVVVLAYYFYRGG